MNRREFLRTAGGATGAGAALGASGTAAAQENESDGNESDESGGGGGGGGEPDFGGFLDGANNYDGSVEDMTGQDEVTVEVGAGDGLAFGPPAVHVDNGATVVWEWTGEGGQHNVVETEDVFNSGQPVAEAGTTFEYTFEEDGIYNYVCEPHEGSGMLGSVVVGSDYPSIDPGVSTPVDPEHVGVPFQAHWVGISTIVAILVSLVFTFYTLKYGESPNTKGGNN